MARLFNMHGAAVENGFAGKDAAYVLKGEVGEFNTDNPAIKIWMRARKLIPEGEVLASKATALHDAPTLADVTRLRAELASVRAAADEQERRAVAKAEEFRRVEGRFSELSVENDSLKARAEALAAECAELRAALDSATKPAAPAPASPLPKAGPGRQQREG